MPRTSKPEPTTKRNDRKNLWNGKREPWIQIYTDVRKSADADESRAYFRVHEFEKVGKNKGRMGIGDGLNIGSNPFKRRKKRL